MADLKNSAMRCNTPALLYMLDDMLEVIVQEALPTLQPELSGFARDPYLRGSNAKPAAYPREPPTGGAKSGVAYFTA